MVSPALKIIHINTEKGWRGGEAQVYLLLKGQIANGHYPVLACLPESKLFAEIKKTNLCPLIPFSCRNEWNIFSLYRFIKSAKQEKPDIIHTHTGHAVLPGLFLKWKLKKPCLFHSRRVDFPLNIISKHKYLACDSRIIVISEGVCNVLLKCGVPKEKIHIVHSGISTELIDAVCDTGKYRQEFDIPDNVPVVGVVAALTDHKGHKYLIEAFPGILKTFPDTILIIVGTGELDKILYNHAHRLGILSNVRFTGYRKDAKSIINIFDIFTLPSHLEGLGTSLLDAMLRGKPVVATSVGGIPEVVLNAKTGILVPPKNPDELGNAIIELLKNSELRKTMGQEGKKRVLEKFSAEQMVSETQSVYIQKLNHE
ncbi:MAG: hypothetical protein A2161_14915 [Candidatus Schekmanbacteria bacterium RBG_13_48_7]|uniref:Glycosyl transferase family 1 n=1 Tax=Candidatus Schekmanbacteria bacterium RBG_13_48_7 TaxID=1817878 RepID=A0A1F7RXY2_9BACT|nr:MAG: hypothetical protein A2161_14915 [Candidatus Schekmanbacteria bacterium RBG_13_48_7]